MNNNWRLGRVPSKQVGEWEGKFYRGNRMDMKFRSSEGIIYLLKNLEPLRQSGAVTVDFKRKTFRYVKHGSEKED